MTKQEEKLLKQFDKLEHAVNGILLIYGPKPFEEIQDNVLYYFPDLYDVCDGFLKHFLDGLVKNKRLEKSNKLYSVIPFKIVTMVNEVAELHDFLPIGEKIFSSKEILTYGDETKLFNSKDFKPLRNYFENNIENKEVLNDVLYTLIFLPYYFAETVEVYRIVCDIAKQQFDEEKFEEMYSEYMGCAPRYFLDGYSFKEYGELVLKMYPEEFEEKKDNLIKKYPYKKDYPHFTYFDLIELGKKISKTKIYKLIDSDRILELTFNNKKVYTQILGFYGKDIGILIYPNKEEMMSTYHFMVSDQETYPDIPFRIRNIEVCLNDPRGFATNEVLQEMEKNNYPEYPSFIRLETNHANRLINEEEIQIVGGVLSDLLTYIQTNDLSDISLHLGEKNDSSYDIDQLYVTKKETIYGGYNEIELEDAFLNFKVKPVDKNIVKKLKNFKKSDITIGCYIYPSVIENNEMPYVLIVRDNKSGKIIDMFLKKLSEMPDIKNDLLKVLMNHKICPDSIYVNNDYTFEIFDEYMDYFTDYWFSEDNTLNEIYKDALDFDLREGMKEMNKKFN